MLFVVLFAALVVGYVWMRSRLKAIRASVSAPPFTVDMDSDGLTLRKGSRMRAWMRWEDIRAVRAFKVDCYAYDSICFAVESRTDGAGFLVNEDHPQFKEML